MEQKGPRRASCLWSQRAGDPTWEPSMLPELKCVEQTPPAPLPLLWSWRAPPACLSCSPPASLLCPQDPHGPEGLWRVGDPTWELSRLPGLEWAGDTLGVLPPIRAPKGPSKRGNPSPPATPQGRRSRLASTSPPPSVTPCPTSSPGGLSCHLGRRGPPSASCRCPSCGEMRTPCLPTLPS